MARISCGDFLDQALSSCFDLKRRPLHALVRPAPMLIREDTHQ
jgi:hypothetical protein